jgi:hypothetical protein
LTPPAASELPAAIPGLNLDHPRQLAVMQAIVCFSHIAAASTFGMEELHARAAKALDFSTADCKLGSLRYETSKLRAKGLVEKLPHSQRYRLLPLGYKISVVHLKLFQNCMRRSRPPLESPAGPATASAPNEPRSSIGSALSGGPSPRPMRPWMRSA